MQKKITIHLKHLLEEKIITEDEAQRLIRLSENKSGGSVFRNLMVIFGTLSIVAGFLGLAPNPNIAAFLAMVVLGGGYYLYYNTDESWKFVAQSFGFLGTIGITAWLVTTTKLVDFFDPNYSDIIVMWVIISSVLLLVAFTMHNKFLAGLFPIALAQLVGASTFYAHASYYLSIRQPSIAIIVFSVIAVMAYVGASKLRGIYDDLCTIIARVSLFIINMAFWIGSLFGDEIGKNRWNRDIAHDFIDIGENYFTIGWLALLLVAIWWGAQRGLGYVVNLSIVFLGIHFYTQYFETVGASPLGLLIGGILIFATSIGWWKYKDELEKLILSLKPSS